MVVDMVGRVTFLVHRLWPFVILASFVPVTAQEKCEENNKWCENGYCCSAGECCLYYHETWWFWLMWAFIFLMLSCCFYQREKICRRRRQEHPVQSHPYQQIISTTTIIPIPSDINVRLPSYEEAAIAPKGPPPEYNQVYENPALQDSHINPRSNTDEQEENDWEVPSGTPPPPYTPTPPRYPPQVTPCTS